MIENLAVVATLTDFDAAHPVGANRRPLFDPIHHVEVMDVLLANMVAAQPDEVVPVAHLVFHFRELSPGFLFEFSASRTQGVVPFQ